MNPQIPPASAPAPADRPLTADQAVECLLHRLPALLRQLWTEARRELAATYALTETQLGLIHALHHHDYTIGELADRLKLHLPSVSRISDALVAQGYVARQADTTDRRKVRLALTPAGRELADTTHRHSHDLIARRLAPLTPDDLACIVGACAAFEKLLGDAAPAEQTPAGGED